MGRVVLLNWREARRLERTQAAFASGTLVGVQATADGRLTLIDPGAPTFSRNSVAYRSDGTQVASGQPRFETVSGRMGVLVEEGTTNLALNPSFENDSNSDGLADNWNLVVGGGISVVASRVASPKFHGSYAQKLEVTSVTPPTGTQFHRIEQIVSVTPNQAYTLSVNALTSTTVYNVDVRIRWRDSGGNVISEARLTSKPTSLTRLSVSGTAPANAVTAILYLGLERPNQYDTTLGYVIFDAVQFEAKSYATTWTDGTREAETLTVPTAGVLNPQEGTFESWIYIPSASFGRAAVVLDVRDSTDLNRLYFEVDADKKPTAAINKNATRYVAKGPNPLSPGWHFVAMSWSSTRLACYADGALVAQYTSQPLLDNIATAVLGSITTSAYHFNSLIGAVRISRRARTDQEIAAAYAAWTLEADEDTTYLLRPDGAIIYGCGGYRIAPPIDLTPVGTAWGSRVTWTAQGSGAQILTSLDGGQTWQQATNGGPVPGVSRGMDVTGKVLTVKQRLVAQDMAAAPVMTMSDAVVMAEPQRGADVGRVRLVGSGAGRVRIL